MPSKPKDPTRVPFMLYLPVELRRRLKIHAHRQGTSCSAIVQKAIEREVK